MRQGHEPLKKAYNALSRAFCCSAAITGSGNKDMHGFVFIRKSGPCLVILACLGGPVLFASATAAVEEQYRWSNVTMTAPFAPRDGAGALVYRDKMWLIGGWNSRNEDYFPLDCINDVWSSTDGTAWVLARANTFGTSAFNPEQEWEGRHTAGYVVHRDKMWILGGDPIQGHYQNDVWNSEDGRTWTQANKDIPGPWAPRVLQYTVAFRDKIWVMGGQTLPQHAPAQERFYNDIWNSEDGIHWTLLKPKGPRWKPRGMIGGGAVFKSACGSSAVGLTILLKRRSAFSTAMYGSRTVYTGNATRNMLRGRRGNIMMSRF